MTRGNPRKLDAPNQYSEFAGYALLGVLLLMFSYQSLIFTGLSVLTIILLGISSLFFYLSLREYHRLNRCLLLGPGLIRVVTRGREQVVDFSELISVKFQHQKEFMGYSLFHPVQMMMQLLTDRELSQTYFKIETDQKYYEDTYINVPQDEVTAFLMTIQDFTSLKPLTKKYSTSIARGIIYYFSFREYHHELSAESSRELR